MDPFISVEDSHVDVLHEISVRLSTADGFHDVLNRVVEFAIALVKCDSCLIYVLDEDELVLRENESTYIPIGMKHRLENRNARPLRIIEVQVGDYLGEDDIVRLEDRYKRTT